MRKVTPVEEFKDPRADDLLDPTNFKELPARTRLPATAESEIKSMAVESAHRGRGIGRTLIRAAIERTRARNHSTLAVATAAADVENLRFYQLAGFRMRAVERDAFTPSGGYPAGLLIDGIPLRDRVWLDLQLDPAH